MSTHVITSLTLDSLDQLSAHARRCVFWEMDPGALHDARGFCDQEFEKEAWLSMVMLEWGSCGQVAVRDGKPLGSALYAPPRMIPRAQLFPTSPVSSDAVLLTSLRLEPSGIEEELGPSLLAAVVTDLVRRGVRALEAFGIRSGDLGPASDVASATATLGMFTRRMHDQCRVPRGLRFRGRGTAPSLSAPSSRTQSRSRMESRRRRSPRPSTEGRSSRNGGDQRTRQSVSRCRPQDLRNAVGYRKFFCEKLGEGEGAGRLIVLTQ